MNQYYNSKAKASFRTKLNLFIYEHVLSPDEWTFDVESFNRFQITPEKVQEYSTEYWQSSYTDKIRDHLEVKTIAERIASVRKNHKTIIEQFQSHYIIDDSNLEYRADNSVMCCYWCNNATTDEFTHVEFVEIGKAIRKVWDDRLEAKDS